MKRIILSLITICCAAGLSAQQLTTQQILDKTAKKVSSGCTAKFTFSNQQAGQLKGNIALKGSKFRTQLDNMTVWFDGKTQWTYMKETDEVNISVPNATQKAQINPYTFLQLYKKGYKYSHQLKGGNYIVKLTPENKKSSFTDIVITIRKADLVPTDIKFQYAGKQNHITINQFKQQKLNDGTFVFNPKQYPSAEIVDLR